MIINQSRKVSVLQTFSEVLIENLLAEILPVTESLSRWNFMKISFLLIWCICVIQYYKLFFSFSLGKLIELGLLKHQVKTFVDILVSLSDGFHDSYNHPMDRFFPKTNQNFVYAKTVKGFQEAK